MSMKNCSIGSLFEQEGAVSRIADSLADSSHVTQCIVDLSYAL